MKKLLFLLVIIQGVLLSSVVDSIEIKGVRVPVVFEKDSSLPIVSMQLVFKNSGNLFSGKKELLYHTTTIYRSQCPKSQTCKTCTRLGLWFFDGKRI